MMYRAFRLLPVISIILVTKALPEPHSSANSARVASMERKLDHIESNAALAKPDTTPTEFGQQLFGV
jgi:hypothetical protein